MILIGIDDTDVAGSRGTNQLARRIVRELAAAWRCVRIVRHQLLDDPRVPCTTKNGSASIMLASRNPEAPVDADALFRDCRRIMESDFLEGSDPGLSLLDGPCPETVVDWGLRCQREFVDKAEAFRIAAAAGARLESLGGSEDGVIGALTAVGLAATENDGRIVQLGEWPDDLSGLHSVDVLRSRGVVVREHESQREIRDGAVDVGKHLRPNVRDARAVLFVECGNGFAVRRAIRLP